MVKLSSQKLWGCMWVNILIYDMVLVLAFVCSHSPVWSDEVFWIMSVYAVIPTYVVKLLIIAVRWHYGYIREFSKASIIDLTLSTVVLILYLPNPFIMAPPEILTEIGQKFAWRVKTVCAANIVIFAWLVYSFVCDYLSWRQTNNPEEKFSDFIANCLDAQKQSGGGLN